MNRQAPQPLHPPDDGQRNTRARFEQWAKNPSCDANTVSAVFGVPMRDVAKAEGASGDYGQSPFALARGQTFEDSLLRDDGQRLISALIEADVLAEGSSGLLDLRTRRHRGTSKDLTDALDRTKAHLRSLAGPPNSRPKQCVVAGAALHIPGDLMIPETVLILDVLAVRADEERPELIVGEVKTYPDRAGYTDPGELATARAQAGVYVAGLELCIKEWDLGDQLRISHRGFLVLTRSGSNMPSIRANEDLTHQRKRALRGFERLHAIAQSIPKPVHPTTSMDAIRTASTQYGAACVAFCERADLCRERAASYGNPATLGDEMSQWLGGLPLGRALALLDGASPESAPEQDIVERFRELGAGA
jgi:hypothetical protein